MTKSVCDEYVRCRATAVKKVRTVRVRARCHCKHACFGLAAAVGVIRRAIMQGVDVCKCSRQDREQMVLAQ